MNNNEYYESFKKTIGRETNKVDLYIMKADKYRKLHEQIKDKTGMFKLLDKQICRMNRRYYQLGMKLAMERFNECIEEIDYLQKTLHKDEA